MIDAAPKHMRFNDAFKSENAAIDPRTVPTVPKLLPPLPRVSPTNKGKVDQVCFQWNDDQPGNTEPSMLCFASVKQEDDSLRRNPFSGLYINYLYGTKSCESYNESSHNGSNFEFNTNPSNHQIDLGKKFAEVHTHANKVLVPTYEVGSKYFESWKDGSQVAFIKKFFSAAQSGDGIMVAKKSIVAIKKVLSDEE